MTSGDDVNEEPGGNRKGGRPRKSDAERQENRVVLRFSDEQFKQITDQIRPGGQGMSGVIKEWIKRGRPAALTAEQHAYMRSLPNICNDLSTIAKLLSQQPDRQDVAADLLAVRERLVHLLTSFQR